MAKGWNPIDNSTGMGNYWSTYPATGVTPSSGGTDLMVSKYILSNTKAGLWAGPGGETDVCGVNSSDMDYGLTWASAVQRCNEWEEDGYNDWYLPNAMELEILHVNKYLGRPLNWKTGGESVRYFTSTEAYAHTVHGREYFSGWSSLAQLRSKSQVDMINLARCVRRN
jgi:hypothetical protein